MFSYSLKSLRANLTRFVATSLAIILGIGFLAAGLMLTDAVRVGLTGNVEQRYEHVDLAVVSSDMTVDISQLQGIPAAYVKKVRSHDGVAAAAGEMSAVVRVLKSDGTVGNLRTMGRNWIDDDKLNPLELTKGRAPKSDNEVVLSVDAAKSAEADVGDQVDLETPIGPRTAKVVGISHFGSADALDDGGTVSFAESTATEVLNAGTSTVDDIILRASGDVDSLKQSLQKSLPTNVKVQTRAQLIQDVTKSSLAFIRFLRPVLQGFAYLAMFVSGFVIFNTFSVVVTQRYRELALIRAIGGTPKQVRRSLITEGLGIGVGSSAIGIVLGAALGKSLQLILGKFDLSLPGNGVKITLGTVILSMIVGTVVTLLSVIVPAFRAGRTKPVEAMRQSAVDTSGTSKARAYIGGAFLVVALGLLAVNKLTKPHWFFLGPGALLLFVGLFIAGPLLARLIGKLIRPVLSLTGLTGRIAADNVVRNPKRTATTANALVIGLFLVTLVTVSGEALKTATVDQLNKLSSSDFIVASESAIAPTLVDKIDKVKGVTATAPVKSIPITSESGQVLYISGADFEKLRDTTGIKITEGSLEEVTNGDGMASADYSALGGSGGSSSQFSRIGESQTFTTFDGKSITLTISAMFEAKIDSLFLGDVVSPQTFDRLAGDKPVSQIFIRVEPGKADEVGPRLDKAIRGYTSVQVVPGNFIGQTVGKVFDFLIGAVNALLAMSVIVALVGIVNTMTLSIFERRAELGLVRALGMTKGQVASMVRSEAVLMGLMGTVIGMSSGVFLSWILVSSIPEVEIGLSFNWARVGLIFVVGLLVGVLASILPARRATKLDMLDAIRSE
ncbi:MAG: FtsX-like permease family protein [Microthrixaceae bacterium]|nr:FtsX-like permease family protein [Microthrixaceae bacterium]